MDTRHNSAPSTTVNPKRGVVASALAAFFGMTGNQTRTMQAKPVGNRSLPKVMQQEVMLKATEKTDRKNNLRRAVHHQQTALGLFR